MKKMICLLTALILLLAGCASDSRFDPKMARTSLQAHLSEQSATGAELENFEILNSEQTGDRATVTCTVGWEGKTGTYRIVYEKSGGQWVLSSCNLLAELPVVTTPAEESTAGIDTSCMMIPEDAMRFGGHSYYLFTDSSVSSWDDAKLYCEARGGYLAVIASEEENLALYKYAKTLGHVHAFFGITDAGQEGKWEWVPQEQSDYLNWHPGQPNGGVRGNYAQFVENYSDGTKSYTGEWSDSSFGGSHGYGFLCEWPVENTD